MNPIKMNRVDLLAIVRENNTKHKVEYLEAVEDYKLVTVKQAKENLKLANTGDLEKIAQIRSMLPAPQSYEESYNRAIRMLELSIDVIIEIPEEVFNQLVLDEWHWKRGFTTMSTMYKSAM